jgi:hypothetical protein
MVEAATLEISELAYVLVRLEQAVNGTAAGFRQGMAMVAMLFFVMAGAYGFAFHAWGIAAFIALFGAGILYLGKRASARTAPEKMKPVLDAVRDAPEKVVLVRHYQTADSRRVFVTNWLEIRTAEHRLIIKANDDWNRLFASLKIRCPAATVMEH